jgi:hypothetical protein
MTHIDVTDESKVGSVADIRGGSFIFNDVKYNLQGTDVMKKPGKQQKKMLLNKRKVWNLTRSNDSDVQGPIMGNGCFENLWTFYYCHVFNSRVDTEAFGNDTNTNQRIGGRFKVDYL